MTGNNKENGKRYAININKQITMFLVMLGLVLFFANLVPYNHIQGHIDNDTLDELDEIEHINIENTIQSLQSNLKAGMIGSTAVFILSGIMMYLTKTKKRIYIIPDKPFFKKKNIQILKED